MFLTRVFMSMLVVSLLAACQAKSETTAPVTSNNMQAPLTEVGYLTLKSEMVDFKTELNGRTQLALSSEIRPQVSGIVKSQLFKEGQTVKAGDLLYQLDDASYQAAYKQALAALASAQATIKSTKLKDERYASLVKSQSVSKQEADEAHAAYLEALASIDQNKAAIEAAKVNLNYTKITAPISGQIGISSVTRGALVTQNQETALATIRSLDPIYVDLTQSSVDLLRLRKQIAEGKVSASNDRDVTLTLEDGSVYNQTGKLTMQEVNVDETTGAVTLRASFPNPEHLLLPGMFVRATLKESFSTQAILAPQQGITRDAKGNAQALVVNQQNQVEQRAVTTGQAINNKWVITAGLNEGDRLIMEGSGKVKAGATVNPVEMKNAASTTTTGQ